MLVLASTSPANGLSNLRGLVSQPVGFVAGAFSCSSLLPLADVPVCVSCLLLAHAGPGLVTIPY